MFNNFTYKQKFIAILLGFVILLFATYKKTLKHTIAAKKQLAIVNSKLDEAKNFNDDIYSLKADIKSIDNIMGGHSSKPEQVQLKILDFITKKEFNINVVSIKDVHLFSNQEFLVYTNQIVLDGAYKSLINVLYEIEKNFNESRVISSHLYSKKNYRTNTTKLYLEIILQNYENIK